MRYRRSILAWLNERQQVIWHAAARLGTVFAQLLVEQSDVLCARHLDNRTFPDRAPTVIDPSSVLMDFNNIAAEILDANRAVFPFGQRQVAAVDGCQPAWLREAELLTHHECVVLREFAVARTISHV